MNNLFKNFYIDRKYLLNGPAAPAIGMTVAIVLFVAMLVTNRAILEMDFIPFSDFAADILLTQRASHGWLLTGHYSFVGVNHPGPFFLYIKLFGQWLAGSLTGSVFGAQLVGVIACSAFFAGLFAAQVHRLAEYEGACRWTAATTALGSVVLVLFVLRQELINPWMPHVMILPFLTFLTAALLTIRGSAPGLLISTFCAAALVHAYIPMPIVVGPIWLVALVIGGRMRRAAVGHGFSYKVSAGVLVIILCFIAPLVLDTFMNPPGNTLRIVQTALQTKYATPTPSLYQLLKLLGRQWLTLSPVLWLAATPGVIIGMSHQRYRQLLYIMLTQVTLTTLTAMLAFAQAPTPLRPYSAYFFVAPALLMIVFSVLVAALELERRLRQHALFVLVALLAIMFTVSTFFSPIKNRRYFSMKSHSEIRALSQAIATENPPGSKVVLTMPQKSVPELPNVQQQNPLLAALLLDLDNFGISACYPDPALSYFVTPERICSKDYAAVTHAYRVETIPMCRLEATDEKQEKIGQGAIVSRQNHFCVYVHPFSF